MAGDFLRAGKKPIDRVEISQNTKQKSRDEGKKREKYMYIQRELSSAKTLKAA